MKQKKEIHVLYIITQLELGGAQKVCLSLLNNLPQYTIKTFLITGPYGPLINQLKIDSHIDLMPELNQPKKRINLLNDLLCFFKLIKKIRTLKKNYPDLIVHTHSTKAGLMGRWAAFFADVRTRIHTIHGYAFHEYLSWPLWLYIYLCELITSLITTHFICVSSYDVKLGIRYFPNFIHKYSIIRAAVDYNLFYQPARRITLPTVTPFIFGTISCFKQQKNLFDLLKAFASVHQHNNNTRLEIIGDGFLRPELEKWINDHQLTSVITLHGWQHTVNAHMLTWHAFILTSLWEGLPCAIAEARLLKLPVISYNTGGITDIIFHNVNGLIFKQKDWQSLAHGMQELTQKPFLFSTLHRYKDDLTDFDTQIMAQHHSLLYKKLSGSRY